MSATNDAAAGSDRLVIRPATASDLDQVAAIYAWECEHSYATFDTVPRPADAWAAKLQAPDPFLVAVDGADVLGFAYASWFREREAYHPSRETTVYVRTDAQGRRIGTRLYQALLPRIAAQGIHTVVALVALPNPGSVALHESTGFTLAGTMREVGEKFGDVLDVGIYQLMLAN